MKIGVVLRSRRKKGVLRKIKITEISQEFIAAEIPFLDADIKKAQRMFKRAERKLRRFGAEKIIYEKRLKETPFDPSQVFYKLAGKGTKILAERFETGIPFCLHIRQGNPDFKAFYLMRKLIYDAKKISILTDKNSRASKMQQKIMEEFGAEVEVLPYSFYPKEGITINLDKNEICIFGKWVLRDFEVEIEKCGFDIDSLELFSLQNKNFQDAVIKSCRCGKNKLTLSEI